MKNLYAKFIPLTFSLRDAISEDELIEDIDEISSFNKKMELNLNVKPIKIKRIS